MVFIVCKMFGNYLLLNKKLKKYQNIIYYCVGNQVGDLMLYKKIIYYKVLGWYDDFEGKDFCC